MATVSPHYHALRGNGPWEGVMKMLKLVKNFPVPAVGVVASVLAVVVQALESSPSWEAAVPAVAAAVAALFVTPSYRVSSSNYVVRSTSRAYSERGFADTRTIAVVALVIAVVVALAVFTSVI